MKKQKINTRANQQGHTWTGQQNGQLCDSRINAPSGCVRFSILGQLQAMQNTAPAPVCINLHFIITFKPL